MTKPILSKQLDDQIQQILAPFRSPEAWQELKLPFSPVPSALVLLTGPPGTGKTSIARYMARSLRVGIVEVSFASVASSGVGDTEKAIQKVFVDNPDAKFILLDECDSILWNRQFFNENNTHMIGIVNTLLTCLDAFLVKGGLVVMTTNFEKILDNALLSRVTDKILIDSPTPEQSKSLWYYKLPEPLKNELTKDQYGTLVGHNLTPREIEQKIFRACRIAFSEDRKPTYEDLWK